MKASEDPLMCLTDVEWREVGEDDTSIPLYVSSATCPSGGEVRWARINADYMASNDVLKVGQRRWLFYTPPDAYINGFEESNAHELDLCVIVEVELTQVLLRRASGRQWMECRCLQVVPLIGIADVFPPMPLMEKRDSNLWATLGQTMTHFIAQTQEVHNWYVTTNPKASRHALPHMVLCGCDFDSYGFICNWVVECDKTSWKAS